MPEEKSAAPPKPYAMPPISVGDMVLWRFHGGNREPTLGVVTSIGTRSINVSLIIDDQPVLTPKRGARHKTDPELAKMVEAPGGVWEYTETHAKIRDLLGIA